MGASVVFAAKCGGLRSLCNSDPSGIPWVQVRSLLSPTATPQWLPTFPGRFYLGHFPLHWTMLYSTVCQAQSSW